MKFDGNLFRRPDVLLFLLIAFFLIGQVLLMPEMPVWITDNGNKIMTAMRIAGPEHTDAFAPSGIIDNAGDYFPGDFHFRQVAEDGTRRSILPVAFPLLLSLPKLLTGRYLFLLWPILGTLLTLLLTAYFLRTLHWRPKHIAYGLLLTLLSAPFLFYSGTVWEMTLSCVFPAAAFLLLRKHRAFWAGLALGAGLWFREECAVIAAFTACAILYTGYRTPCETFRRLVFFSAGVLCCGLALCAYNYLFFGHILGLHGALYYTHNAADAEPVAWWIRCVRGYWMYLFRFDGHAEIPLIVERLLYLPLILLPAAGAFRCRKIKIAVLLCACLSWIGFFVSALLSADSVTYAGLNTGFIANSPLYAGFFLTWREQLTASRKHIRAGALIAVLYCVVMPLLLTQTDIGVIWGARHFILLAPLFLLLSLDGFRRLRCPRFPVKKVFAALLMISAIYACYGSYVVVSRARVHAAVAEQLPSGVIVTDVFFLPEMTPGMASAENDIFYVKSDTQFLKLLTELRGHTEVFSLVLCAANPYYGFITDECLGNLENDPGLRLESVTQVIPDVPSFMRFTVMTIRLLPESQPQTVLQHD